MARVDAKDGVVETFYDARKTSFGGAVEVLVRSERRRRWHPQQKLAIVQASLAAGSGPTEVAKRYGISTGLLYTWRKQLLAAATEGFVPCEIVGDAAPSAAPALPAPSAVPVSSAPDPTCGPVRAGGAIDVELPGGAKLRIAGAADAATLQLVLAALAR